ncbi:MAG: phosphoribosylformylglycinamidine synthase I [Ignavibacteriales bacterium CG_4_9_14_3_um_filter_34_10]|nr:MAG: phosphoribosylformylglycinamidine synthase I [Ignavibacteriales bacterium CG_4_9_14_3_um_filter_34_10]
MKPKFGVVVFPGSNCDHDAYYVTKKILDCETEFLWHKDTDLKNCDVIILPGGFSYGDYLRTGAIARFSPIMESVIDFANKGGIVLGICNGFQILIEANLLPGTLMKNVSTKFICKDIFVKVANHETVLTKNVSKNILEIPIAHGDGNYFIDEKGLHSLKENNQIIFQYCSDNGEISDKYNPNGSAENIAGIMNKSGNVFGMMPHPERCSDSTLMKSDGFLLFNTLIQNIIK